MMRKYLLLILSVFFLFSFSATPSIAKQSFKKLALTASGDNSKAEKINNEGVEHFAEGHFKQSAIYFQDALKEDSKLAEAHFNLALTLHKAGKHGDAAGHFKKAAELAPKDERIINSDILKGHLQ